MTRYRSHVVPRLFAILAILASMVAAGCGRFGFAFLGADAADADNDESIDGSIDASSDPSLVLYLPFEGSLDDQAGGQTGSCTECPSYAAGPTGTAGVFSGLDCLRIADQPAFHAPTFTLALRFRATVGGVLETLLSKPYAEASDDDNSWELYTNANAARFKTRDAAVEDILPAGTFTIGTWAHIAATYDGTTKRSYIGGALQDVRARGPIAYDASAIRIGCDLDLGTEVNFFQGELDEIRIYDRALSPTEIAALAQ